MAVGQPSCTLAVIECLLWGWVGGGIQWKLQALQSDMNSNPTTQSEILGGPFTALNLFPA